MINGSKVPFYNVIIKIASFIMNNYTKTWIVMFFFSFTLVKIQVEISHINFYCNTNFTKANAKYRLKLRISIVRRFYFSLVHCMKFSC